MLLSAKIEGFCALECLVDQRWRLLEESRLKATGCGSAILRSLRCLPKNKGSAPTAGAELFDCPDASVPIAI